MIKAYLLYYFGATILKMLTCILHIKQLRIITKNFIKVNEIENKKSIANRSLEVTYMDYIIEYA